MTEMDIDVVKQVGFRLTAVGFFVFVWCYLVGIRNVFMGTRWSRLQAYLAPEPQDCVYRASIPIKWNELCIWFRATPCVLAGRTRIAAHYGMVNLSEIIAVLSAFIMILLGLLNV